MYTVAGGGLAGLVAAARIAAAGRSVRLFEPADTIGGRARTYDTGGNPVERFPGYLTGSTASMREVTDLLGGDAACDDADAACDDALHATADRLLWRRGRTARYLGGVVHPVDAPWERLAYPGLGLRNALRLRRLGRTLAGSGDLEGDPAGSQTVESAVTGSASADLYTGWFEPLVRAEFGDRVGEVPDAWLHEWAASRARHDRDGERVAYLDGSLGTLVGALVDSLAERVGDDAVRRGARVVEVEPRDDDGDTPLTVTVEAGAEVRRVETDGVVVATGPTDLERTVGVETELDAVPETCALVTAEESLTDAWRVVLDDDTGFEDDMAAVDDTSVGDAPSAHAPFDVVIEHTNLVSTDRYDGEHILYLVGRGRSEPGADRDDARGLRDRWLAALSDRFPGFSEEAVRSFRVARDPAAAVVPASAAPRSRTVPVDLADFGAPGVAYAGPGTVTDRFGTAVSTRLAAGVAAAEAVLPASPRSGPDERGPPDRSA